MHKIEIDIYKRTVLLNKTYFAELDKELQNYSKIFEKLSKDCNNGGVLEAEIHYDNVCVEDVITTLVNKRPRGVELEVVLWFISFDLNFSNRVQKKSFYGVMKSYIKTKDTNSWDSFNPGFISVKNKSSDKKYLFHESKSQSPNHYGRVSIAKVINDCKQKLNEYEAHMAFLVGNLNIMPSSVKRVVDRVNRIEENSISQVLDAFQYRLYLKTLPAKYTETFIKNELRRLKMTASNDTEKLKTVMLVFNAMIEKYGIKSLLSTKYCAKIVHTNIILNHGARGFNDLDFNRTLTPGLYKLMSVAMLENIGFAKSNDLVKEYTQIHQKSV